MSTPYVGHYVHMSSTTYGHWLKEQRKLRRMPQAELEERADLSVNYVSRVENGRLNMPTEEVRQRIHAAFGTTEEDLVEAGLLRRMQYNGRTWYVPIRDEGRAAQDAPPLPGAVGFNEVVTAFTDAARGITWTPQMVNGIVQQIKMYGTIQEGIAPAQEDEGESNGIAAG